MLLCASFHAHAVEWSGLLDMRAVAADTQRSWSADGLGKQRYGENGGNLRLGQAIVRAEAQVLDSVSAIAVLGANDDRDGIVDLNEAWLAWNPVPSSAWKFRTRLGAFFPVSSLEIDYDSIGWTPSRTLSSSAINSWIGEELRTQGIEISALRNGRFARSAHDFGFTAALFGGNDPAGSLMAWRGWSVGDRISSLNEAIRLADLPVIQAGAPLASQDRNIHVFREIDDRPGYYLGTNYAHSNGFELALLHYDNRGDPLAIEGGQYSWDTRFDHLSLRFGQDSWELLFQAMRGETVMGPDAVRVDFHAWYALASTPLGEGRLTLRVDKFGTSENDILPSDPNAEHGEAVALAYAHAISRSLSLVAEALLVRSRREARNQLGEDANQTERSLSVALRWQF